MFHTTNVYYPKDIYLGKMNFVRTLDGKNIYETDQKYSAFKKENGNHYELLLRSNKEKNKVLIGTVSQELIVPLKKDQKTFIDDLESITTYLQNTNVGDTVTLKEISTCIARANQNKIYKKRV